MQQTRPAAELWPIAAKVTVGGGEREKERERERERASVCACGSCRWLSRLLPTLIIAGCVDVDCILNGLTHTHTVTHTYTHLKQLDLNKEFLRIPGEKTGEEIKTGKWG